jgi:hypothetical protein
MTHMPRKRQSVTPNRALLIAVGAIVVFMAVVAIAVGLAMANGGSDCPAGHEKGPVSDSCQ